MHGKGRMSAAMRGLGFLKSAGKTIKKATKKKNVRKLMNTVQQIADVAQDFAVTEEGRDRAIAVDKAAGKLKKRNKGKKE